MKKVPAPLIVSALMLASAGFAFAAGPSPRPNVVIFLADDLSRNDCSIYNPQCGIRTPNMERLAKEGLIFTQAKTQTSGASFTRPMTPPDVTSCSGHAPSRSALIP